MRALQDLRAVGRIADPFVFDLGLRRFESFPERALTVRQAIALHGVTKFLSGVARRLPEELDAPGQRVEWHRSGTDKLAALVARKPRHDVRDLAAELLLRKRQPHSREAPCSRG